MMTRLLRTIGSISLSLTMACGDSHGPEIPLDVRPFVTAELGATLDANGAFQYVSPSPDTQYEIISPSDGAAFAASFLQHTVGTLGLLARPDGNKLSYDELTIISGAAFFAATAVEDVPVWVSMPSRRHVGPWYLFPVVAHNEPVGTVSVSAWVTDYMLDAAGRIVFPRWSGNAFSVSGLQEPSGQLTVPLTPEQAAVAVATQTDALVSALPTLISPVPPASPAERFKWKVNLDRAVHWRSEDTQTTTESPIVYVGFEPVQIAGKDEPVLTFYQPAAPLDSVVISVSIRDSVSLELLDTVNLSVSIRVDVPSVFIIVRP